MLKINIEYLIEHIEKSLEFGELEVSKLKQDIFDIKGLTSHKVRCFLNNICGVEDSNYLELGVHRGATFCSAIYANYVNAVAIDNWSAETLMPATSLMSIGNWQTYIAYGDPKEQFLSNIKKFKSNNDIKVFDKSYLDFDIGLIPFKINILFYDGEHTYEDQYQMLTTFYDILTDISILIIDDWNWEQRGILEAIENLNFDVLYNKEIYTSGEDPNDFWNGLGIFVLKK